MQDRLKQVAALHRLQKVYRQLDYEASELIYLQSLALQGAYGRWETVNVGNSNDAFRLQDRTPLIRGRVKQLAAAVRRSRVASDEDKLRFTQTVEQFNLMLDAGLEIYQLIYADDFDGANLVWRDTSRPLWLDIRGEAYTLIGDLDSRISRALIAR